MPTYEYECPKCGVFDHFQSIKAEPLQRCPTCRRKIRRLLGSGAGIIFKGSGFYQTDYRSAGYQAAAKKDKETTSAPPPAKTESKSVAPSAPAPAAKPDKKKSGGGT